MFDNQQINFELLKKRAYNLRWATVPEGVIPLTAADPDFPCAPEIADELCRFARDRYFSYGPVEGMTDFREAMANYYVTKGEYRLRRHIYSLLTARRLAYILRAKPFYCPAMRQ